MATFSLHKYRICLRPPHEVVYGFLESLLLHTTFLSFPLYFSNRPFSASSSRTTGTHNTKQSTLTWWYWPLDAESFFSSSFSFSLFSHPSQLLLKLFLLSSSFLSFILHHLTSLTSLCFSSLFLDPHSFIHTHSSSSFSLTILFLTYPIVSTRYKPFFRTDHHSLFISVLSQTLDTCLTFSLLLVMRNEFCNYFTTNFLSLHHHSLPFQCID